MSEKEENALEKLREFSDDLKILLSHLYGIKMHEPLVCGHDYQREVIKMESYISHLS